VNRIFEAALDIQGACQSRGWQFCVIGGVAVQRWGEPISLGAMPFEERAVARGSPFALDGDRSILTCSAEDLVVLKAFAGRDQDWLDIEGVITRRGPALEAALILRELEPLLELKEDMRALGRVRGLLERFGK